MSHESSLSWVIKILFTTEFGNESRKNYGIRFSIYNRLIPIIYHTRYVDSLQHKITSHSQIWSIVDKELQPFWCSENYMHNGRNITNQQGAHNSTVFNIINGKQAISSPRMCRCFENTTLLYITLHTIFHNIVCLSCFADICKPFCIVLPAALSAYEGARVGTGI